MKLSQLVQVGLEFYEFLNETNRSSITERNRLSEVYNREFRSRIPGSKDPSFGSLLYGLKTHGKITVRRGTIRFNPKVRALYVDQWSTSRTQRSQPAQGGGTSPGTPPTSTSPDGAETGVRARRQMASRLMTKLKTERSMFISDKHGVSITSEQQFNQGKLSLCMEGTYEYEVKLSVRNSGAEPVLFTYYAPLHWLKHLALTDEHKVTRRNPRTLGPGESYDISVSFRCSWVGFYPVTLAFEFKPDLEPTSAEFYIVRFIEARCITALGVELAPIAPYKPQPLCTWTPEVHCTIVDGQRPEGMSVLQLKNEVPLKQYRIPAYVNQLIESLKSGQPGQRQTLLETPLSWEVYTQKFQLLLFLEERQMESDIKRYNIPNNERAEHAVMSRDPVNKKLLVLDVPGVAENRPSVLRGDVLLVCPSGESGVKYRGYVHSVELNKVKLGFSSNLLSRFFEGMRFRVEFTLNRTGLRVQHRAAELAAEHGLEELLFPAAPAQRQPELPDLRLFDRNLEKNPQQLGAVQHIVAGSSKPAPYLVFGPPGTGEPAAKRTDRGQPEDRQRTDRGTDRGQTEDRQRADRGQTEDRQRADRGQTEDRQRTDRGQTEDRQRTDRGTDRGQTTRTDRGQTEDRQRTDRGQTEDRQRTDRGQTEDRQRTDRGQTGDRQRTDRGQTEDRQRAARGQTEDRQRAARGQTEDRQRTARGQTEDRQGTDRGQTEDRQRTDRGQTEDRQRTDRGQTEDRQRTDRGQTSSQSCARTQRKTVTLVEAIKQIEKTQASCHILACAPSNSAADLLCKKILDHVDHFKVYRMYASSREPRCVPEELQTCSNLVGDCYVFPAKEELMEFRVLVTTLVTAGRLVTGGIPPGHFTHVFVDEGDTPWRPRLLHAHTGQVVLAGDPKQLGPILRSPLALKHGLGVSLLQRMMTQFSLYQKDEGEWDRRFVTKLLCNYRSHPSILEVPNELFYDSELLCSADEVLRNSYCNWEHLPKKGFPVIFHGVTGVDEREASSPSFFNRAEVEQLVEYVKKLLQNQGKKGLATISPRDIGIIAPYRKQVQKIRQALNKVEKNFKFMNMDKLKVGSVEEFQGQERRVILVSTVRSSSSYTDFDKQFNLGFVKNEKRFNVAITRAKALLIVLGNPRVLNTDPTWAHFIKFCSDSGGYDGVALSGVLAEEEEEVVSRLAALYIRMEAQEETEESVVQQHLDPEWRSDL
ncbi:unnamed protein product [Pleuronectes platessa]|uniref:RNA helicase n=1 Tax=Pleuronectes platessa TaxID=8262 RepID=A0A9N7YEU4_PLEPL|nr:unnamed protein product [Pleuronectes platessa]